MIENCVATELSFPAISCATLHATSTVTAPSAVGVISNVYVSPSTAIKFPAVPFPTVISQTTNPVTI